MAGLARWSPVSGLIFVALWISLFVIAKDPGDADAEITAYFADDDNRTRQVWTFFFVLAAALFFVWFLAVLRGRLAQAEGRPGPLTALAFGAGLVAVGLWIVADVFFSAVSFAVDFTENELYTVEPNTFRLIDNIGYTLWFSGTTVASLVVIATSILSVKTGLLPKWLGWVGFVAAAAMLVAFFFIPFLIWLGWVLLVSVWLIWKPVAGDAPSTAPSS
jgi:hypothetical protein